MIELRADPFGLLVVWNYLELVLALTENLRASVSRVLMYPVFEHAYNSTQPSIWVY